jgi:hypothetical protein
VEVLRLPDRAPPECVLDFAVLRLAVDRLVVDFFPRALERTVALEDELAECRVRCRAGFFCAASAVEASANAVMSATSSTFMVLRIMDGILQ